MIAEEKLTNNTEVVATEILTLERAALDRWGKGDPDGILDLYAEDVDYFDPFQAARVKGREEMRRIYDGLRGLVKLESSNIVDPNVRVCGDMAVLTFNFVSRMENGSDNRWNATEVYQQIAGKWLIVHAHWSYTQPKLASSQQ